jgi:hypothetical protein
VDWADMRETARVSLEIQKAQDSATAEVFKLQQQNHKPSSPAAQERTCVLNRRANATLKLRYECIAVSVLLVWKPSNSMRSLLHACCMCTTGTYFVSLGLA